MTGSWVEQIKFAALYLLFLGTFWGDGAWIAWSIYHGYWGSAFVGSLVLPIILGTGLMGIGHLNDQ